MRSINFKLAYSQQTRSYYVDPRWKIEDFFNIMKSRIIRDFHIEQFDLVDAGQNTSSGRPEEGLKLNRYEPICLAAKYGENVNVSFYIRPVNDTMENEAVVPTTNTNRNATNVSECIVCFEELPSIRYYICGHNMCTTCLNNCIYNNIRSCPMCRCEIPMNL
jgi:hypothetical protein